MDSLHDAVLRQHSWRPGELNSSWLDVRDRRGRTALHVACRAGRAGAAAALLAAGANHSEVESEWGGSCGHTAAARGHTAVLDAWRAAGGDDEALEGVMLGLLEQSSDWVQRHGQTLAAAALLRHVASGERWAAAPAVVAAAGQLAPLFKDDRVPVRCAAARVVESMLRLLMSVSVVGSAPADADTVMDGLWKSLVKLLADSAPDVRLAAVGSIKVVSKTVRSGRLGADVLEVVVVPVFNLLRDKTPDVSRAAQVLLPPARSLRPLACDARPSLPRPRPHTHMLRPAARTAGDAAPAVSLQRARGL